MIRNGRYDGQPDFRVETLCHRAYSFFCACWCVSRRCPGCVVDQSQPPPAPRILLNDNGCSCPSASLSVGLSVSVSVSLSLPACLRSCVPAFLPVVFVVLRNAIKEFRELLDRLFSWCDLCLPANEQAFAESHRQKIQKFQVQIVQEMKRSNSARSQVPKPLCCSTCSSSCCFCRCFSMFVLEAP